MMKKSNSWSTRSCIRAKSKVLSEYMHRKTSLKVLKCTPKKSQSEMVAKNISLFEEQLISVSIGKREIKYFSVACKNKRPPLAVALSIHRGKVISYTSTLTPQPSPRSYEYVHTTNSFQILDSGSTFSDEFVFIGILALEAASFSVNINFGRYFTALPGHLSICKSNSNDKSRRLRRKFDIINPTRQELYVKKCLAILNALKFAETANILIKYTKSAIKIQRFVRTVQHKHFFDPLTVGKQNLMIFGTLRPKKPGIKFLIRYSNYIYLDFRIQRTLSSVRTIEYYWEMALKRRKAYWIGLITQWNFEVNRMMDELKQTSKGIQRFKAFNLINNLQKVTVSDRNKILNDYILLKKHEMLLKMRLNQPSTYSFQLPTRDELNSLINKSLN